MHAYKCIREDERTALMDEVLSKTGYMSLGEAKEAVKCDVVLGSWEDFRDLCAKRDRLHDKLNEVRTSFSRETSRLKHMEADLKQTSDMVDGIATATQLAFGALNTGRLVRYLRVNKKLVRVVDDIHPGVNTYVAKTPYLHGIAKYQLGFIAQLVGILIEDVGKYTKPSYLAQGVVQWRTGTTIEDVDAENQRRLRTAKHVALLKLEQAIKDLDVLINGLVAKEKAVLAYIDGIH